MKLKHLYENYQLKKSDVHITNKNEIIKIKDIQYIIIDAYFDANLLSFNIPRDIFNGNDDEVSYKNKKFKINYDDGRKNTQLLLDLLYEYEHYQTEETQKIIDNIHKVLNVNYNGYSDWYIPSHQELTKIIKSNKSNFSIQEKYLNSNFVYDFSTTSVYKTQFVPVSKIKNNYICLMLIRKS